jgi:hypothetical protein
VCGGAHARFRVCQGVQRGERHIPAWHKRQKVPATQHCSTQSSNHPGECPTSCCLLASHCRRGPRLTTRLVLLHALHAAIKPLGITTTPENAPGSAYAPTGALPAQPTAPASPPCSSRRLLAGLPRLFQSVGTFQADACVSWATPALTPHHGHNQPHPRHQRLPVAPDERPQLGECLGACG